MLRDLIKILTCTLHIDCGLCACTHTHTAFTCTFLTLSSQLMNLRIEDIAANRSFVFFWVGSGDGLDQGREVLEGVCSDVCTHLMCAGCMWWYAVPRSMLTPS